MVNSGWDYWEEGENCGFIGNLLIVTCPRGLSSIDRLVAHKPVQHKELWGQRWSHMGCCWFITAINSAIDNHAKRDLIAGSNSWFQWDYSGPFDSQEWLCLCSILFGWGDLIRSSILLTIYLRLIDLPCLNWVSTPPIWQLFWPQEDLNHHLFNEY